MAGEDDEPTYDELLDENLEFQGKVGDLKRQIKGLEEKLRFYEDQARTVDELKMEKDKNIATIMSLEDRLEEKDREMKRMRENEDKLIAEREAQDGSGGGGGGAGGKLRVGDKVEARYRGNSRYYPGRISRDRGDGSYDIDYDDGEPVSKENLVWEELIRSLGGEGGGGKLREGAKVEVQIHGESSWGPLFTIKRDNHDGTYDISCNYGDCKMRVRGADIEAQDGGVRGGGVGGKFRQGEKVEARYGGRTRYHPGRIYRDLGDGSYVIDYDDGDREWPVSEDLIRYLGSPSYVSEDLIRKEPSLITREARLRLSALFFGLAAAPAIRPRAAAAPASSGGADGLVVGAKVEAQFRGKGKFFPGKIEAVNADGTFAILYEDGLVGHRDSVREL